MSDELITRVCGIIAKTQHLPAGSIHIDQTFAELKFDSLDAMNILFAVETEFDISIPDSEALAVRSVRQMVEELEKVLAAKST
jgi:acyl carrier protein